MLGMKWAIAKNYMAVMDITLKCRCIVLPLCPRLHGVDIVALLDSAGAYRHLLMLSSPLENSVLVPADLPSSID